MTTHRKRQLSALVEHSMNVLRVDFTGVPLVERPEQIEEGNRNTSLFLRLQATDALRCASVHELMDKAMDYNARLPQPLPRKEVRDLVRKKWNWFQTYEGIQRRAEVALVAPDWERLLSGWKPKDSNAHLLKITGVEFLVRGWIQSTHAGQLIAEGGIGKTTLLIALGIAIATGEDFLGLEIPKPGTFVLLSLDDSQDDLDATLAEILLAKKLSDDQLDLVRHHVRLISLRGCSVSFTYGGERSDVPERIIAALSSVSHLRCIALDTQRQFSGGDSNEDRVAMVAAQSVSKIAERLHVACIVTHHVGKAQSRSGVDDMYVGLGSTATPDTLRFVLRLEPSSWEEVRKGLDVPDDDVSVGDVYRLSSKRGSLRVRPPQPIFFVRDGFRLARIDYAAKSEEQKHAESLTRVIAAIDVAGGALSSNSAAEVLTGRHAHRLNQLRGFVARGWLARESARGALSVTDAGRALSDDSRLRGGNRGNQSAGAKHTRATVTDSRLTGTTGNHGNYNNVVSTSATQGELR